MYIVTIPSANTTIQTMKIEISKIYVNELNYKVTIVAIDPTITNGYHFIGSHKDVNGSSVYRNYNQEGLCASFDGYGNHLFKEYGKPMGFPETEQPYHGTPYWFPDFGNGYSGGSNGYTWSDDHYDRNLLKNGLLFLDKHDAQQASEIIIKLFKEYNELRDRRNDNGETWLFKSPG